MKNFNISNSIISRKVISKATGMEGIITNAKDDSIYVNFIDFEDANSIPVKLENVTKLLEIDDVVSTEVLKFEAAVAAELKKQEEKELKAQERLQKKLEREEKKRLKALATAS